MQGALTARLAAMAKNKRGSELSLSVIVIAIIVLIVLIVMIAIFTGKLNIFGKSTTTCASKGGQCSEKISGGLVCPSGFATVPEKTDCQYACCIQAG